ncbi:hypothetical protein EON65_35540 [archaeon]|nr:MAG: hypothetical protein EON65_35540 [archaeon]
MSFVFLCTIGITRQTIINMCKRLHIPIEERRVSLHEFYTADEVFTTGTMGELTPVRLIDGREIEPVTAGSILKNLQEEYRKLTESQGVPLPWLTTA